MFVGESPGFWEDKIGEPFIGPVGKFLDKLFDLMELKRSKFYITNVLKCRPKIDNRDRPPEKEEITACKPFLLKQIGVIKPEIIVLLGSVSIKALLDEKLKVSEIHGKIIEKDGRIYFPTFHPSAAMRFPNVRRKMEEDFKKLKVVINKVS
jgi:DNA polymerase